ncbi:MAG: isopenicillin N synthase family oxygenase [Leptolyngbya sp. SIO4C5]|nr:isopenicillin N synthase family oxygenase [Leptolyngbya sp. SIO4C5]
MSDTLPIIDFAPFLAGNAAQKAAVAQQVYQACHQIGFMYLKQLRIPSPLAARLFEQSRQFFALPLEAKQAIAWSEVTSNRGYVGLGRERLDPAQPGDLKEAFNIGREPTDEIADAVLNQWPDPKILPHFRATALEFYRAAIGAASDVLRAMAIALDLPETLLAEAHSQQDQTLRLLHYPPLSAAPQTGQTRAGAHSDYGSITLLFQDDIGGLEVRTRQGEWLAAPAIAGAVLVNTGDLMERWTNHEFCSTLHRVRLPDAAARQRSRDSIAFFCQPNPDAEIACLETCQTGDRPPLYPPIKAGDYLLSKLQATY